ADFQVVIVFDIADDFAVSVQDIALLFLRRENLKARGEFLQVFVQRAEAGLDLREESLLALGLALAGVVGRRLAPLGFLFELVEQSHREQPLRQMPWTMLRCPAAVRAMNAAAAPGPGEFHRLR